MCILIKVLIILRISFPIDISPTKPLTLQVDDRHQYYPTESSLLWDLKFRHYSYITVNVLDIPTLKELKNQNADDSIFPVSPTITCEDHKQVVNSS